MKILLIYPRYPVTFWSFSHALKFVSKKASFPPLGLLTVAAMLPAEWEKKLIDMNTASVRDEDIAWAYYVFISAMSIQSESANKLIERCRELGAKTVAGGPLFTSHPELCENIDHLVLDEAEITLPFFLEDLNNGTAKHLYTTDTWAELSSTPLPQWSLLTMRNYSSMNLQYSRGCPFDCDFCDITVLYGRRRRTKTKAQVIAELDALYAANWKGPVFFVDDNFIGNKAKLKKEILPAIIEWNEKRKHPFYFTTEASINLADDADLMRLMREAGFESVFIGIESPNEKSLIECNKNQNTKRSLIESVKSIQNTGMEVQAGFIVGFDNDHPGIFEDLTDFIQKSGIVTAMVGLLNAPKNTKLARRLDNEGRLLKNFTGDNTDFSMNFVSAMNPEILMAGYKRIVKTIYSPKFFYERAMRFIKDFDPHNKGKGLRLNSNHLIAFFRSIYRLGVIGEERFYYWKLFFYALFRKPRLFSLAILYAIYGFHFKKVSNSFY